ncbi:MAG: hypothetical protein ACO1QR_06370 [Chthoniobacteraceae bacterium]
MRLPATVAALLLCALGHPVLAVDYADKPGPAEHQGSQKVIQPEGDGSVVLQAKDATVHGATIRYEPQPHKNTIGYWTNVSDWVSWKVEGLRAGTYAVEVLQGCGKGQDGSEAVVSVGGETLPMVVEDTGHFQNFVPRTVGKVVLPEGAHTVFIRAKMKKGVAVMDVRQVRLVFAKAD